MCSGNQDALLHGSGLGVISLVSSGITAKTASYNVGNLHISYLLWKFASKVLQYKTGTVQKEIESGSLVAE